jgi:hypothetical protein
VNLLDVLTGADVVLDAIELITAAGIIVPPQGERGVFENVSGI